MRNNLPQEISAPQTERLYSIQALRAIAALLVTIAHASEEAKYFFGFEPIFDTDPFGKGVDLFFVLSGFIIYYASRAGTKNGTLSASEFALNRFIRVAPLYYIFTTLMVLTIYFLPSGIKEAKFDVQQIITSYLFIPYERYDGRIAPTLSLGWTLNYEIFFYCIFSVCLAFNSKNAAKTATTLIVLLAMIGAFIPSSAPAAIREWSDSIILEFAFGVAIAYTYEKIGRKKSIKTYKTLAIIAIGFALLYYLNLPDKPLNIPRFLSAGLPSALIVGACVLLFHPSIETKIPNVVTSLGDSSYSLYLSHRFIQRPIQMLFNKTSIGDLPYAGTLYLVAATLSAMIAGHLVYKILEKPLIAKLKSIIKQ